MANLANEGNQGMELREEDRWGHVGAAGAGPGIAVQEEAMDFGTKNQNLSISWKITPQQSRMDVMRIANDQSRSIEMNYYDDICRTLDKARSIIAGHELLETEYLGMSYDQKLGEFVMVGVFRYAGLPLFVCSHDSDIHYSNDIIHEFMELLSRFINNRIEAIESMTGTIRKYGVNASCMKQSVEYRGERAVAPEDVPEPAMPEQDPRGAPAPAPRPPRRPLLHEDINPQFRERDIDWMEARRDAQRDINQELGARHGVDRGLNAVRGVICTVPAHE